MKLSKPYITISFVVLSACGGSGTSMSTTSDGLVSGNYDNLQAAGLNVFSRRYAEAETFVSNLPAGSMTYNGVAAFTTIEAQAPGAVPAISATDGTTADVNSTFISGVPDDATTKPDSLARIQVDVNFTDNIASGTIDNIQHKDGYSIAGSLMIKNGVLTGNELEAKFVGNVNEEGFPHLWEGDLKVFSSVAPHKVFTATSRTRPQPPQRYTAVLSRKLTRIISTILFLQPRL